MHASTALTPVRRDASAALAAMSVIICAGCMPVIAHTPQVSPGAHFTAAGTLSAGITHDDSDSSDRLIIPVPALAFRESYGFRSAPTSTSCIAARLVMAVGIVLSPPFVARGQRPRPRERYRGTHVPRATAGTNFSRPFGGNSSVFPSSAL